MTRPIERTFTAQVQDELIKLAEELRQAVSGQPDPRAQALCETSAEVLLGLQRAFRDYERQREGAFRR